VNNTTGGYAINIKTSSSTGVNIPNGTSGLVYCNGTEFFTVTKGYDSSNVGNTLVLRDSSGNISVTGITMSGPLNTNSSVGTAGQTLVSQGAGLPPTWSTSFISGMIMLWSGSIASIPSGWYLCNGSNGTPDLRDKFVVGAGSTYAVNATGGSADAIVVSHNHTATSSVTDPGHFHPTLPSTSAQRGLDNGGTATLTAGDQRGSENPTASATTGISVVTTLTSAGSSGTGANLPPYYALAYIMKA
jgi:microcystin-dependent protein